MELNKIYQGDSLEILKTFPDESINCVMTSPPYWALRDYGTANWEGGDAECNHVRDNKITERCDTGHKAMKECGVGDAIYKQICGKCGARRIDKQLGLEPTFQEYITKLCKIFDEVKRVLRKDGTCWVNLGDTYYSISGGKYLNDNISSAELNIKKGIVDTNKFRKGKELQQKNLCNIPARFSIAMQDRGWILRNRIIWHKPNCMPSSIKDRFTVDFEDIFFFVKNKKYWFETQYEKRQDTWGGRWGKMPHGNRPNAMIGRKEMSKQEFEHHYGDKRNKRTVWKVAAKPFNEAHFATYPEELCQTPIKAGCPEFVCNKCGKARVKIIEIISGKGEGKPYDANRPDGYIMEGRNRKSEHNFKGLSDCGCNTGFSGGIVLDPFFGAGTTGLVALKLNRKFIGIELNPEYIKIANKRLDCWLNQQRLG